jgi:predicted RNA-binding Zn ribbon-like protein
MAIDVGDVLHRTVALMNVDRARSSQHDDVSIADVLRTHGETLTELGVADTRRATRVLHELARIAEESSVDHAATGLNTLMAKYCARPQLMIHDGWPWHLHVDRGEDEPLHRWIGATGSFAMANALAGRSTVPWGVCAADGCEQIFVHDDRGGTRLHCSTTCGTRVRVARHRARR